MMTANDSVQRLSKEMHAMIKEAEQLLAEAAATSGDKAVQLQKKGMSLLACSIAQAHELERKSMHAMKDVAASTDQLVHANPWRAVAVSGLLGAGIGLALGLAMARD